MPSAKRAKLSHESPEESRALSEERSHADDGEAGDDDAEEEADEDEPDEEEEIIESSEEEEGKIDDEERGHPDGLHEDAIEEVEVEEDEVDQGEIEEVEEEEEIEEVVVEEDEEEEEEVREAGGEEEEEDEEVEEDDHEEGGGSEVESVEEDIESIDNGVTNLTEPEGDGDADYQAARNAGGDVDDADEENEVSVTQHNNRLDDDDNENEEEDDDDDDEKDDDDDDNCNGKQVGREDDGDEEDEHRKQLAVFMCISSLQTLMAMELCRDMTSPFDGITRGDSTMLPVAFLKLVVLAVTSLMHEEGRQYIERGVGSIDSATRDSIWRRKYSMSYACFLYLVEELRPFIQSEAHNYVKAPLEIERAVAMVLYRLAHGLSAREVAEKYNVGASTVGKYTLIITSALSEANKLYGRYVAIPTGDRMARIITQFQQMTNVSQMCGAIDGTHVKLNFKPDKWYGSSAYESPPKFHSILLQAVCDANKLFWDVCCMAPGGAHEAAHFVTSNLYQKVRDGLSLQEPLETLENREVTPFMVGDSAYPLRPFVIKPFETDDALRKAFDDQLRKGLACIDGAFAILKARWRILKCMNVHLMHAPRVAVACCVLHNICQLWGEPEPSHEQLEQHINEHSQGSATVYEIDEAARIAGEAAREALFRDWVKRSLDGPYVSFDQDNLSTGQN